MPVGRVRPLGAPAGRLRVRLQAAGAAAGDRGLRAPADRRAPGRGPRSDPRLRVDALGGSRRFERHHLHATRLSLRVTRATEEVDAQPHDLDDAAPLAVLFPVAAAQVAGDADALSLAEILATELSLPVPHGDADEVGARVPATAPDGEQEVRHLLVVGELAQVDVAREVADQADAVHETERRRTFCAARVTALCRFHRYTPRPLWVCSPR